MGTQRENNDGVNCTICSVSSKTCRDCRHQGSGSSHYQWITGAVQSGGTRRLAARYVASIDGIKGNEALVVKLLTDLENVPTRPGQDTLVSTPAYFSTVSDEIGQAAKAWSDLRGRGVSDADAIAQLSQNAVYGKYVNGEVPVLGQKLLL